MDVALNLVQFRRPVQNNLIYNLDHILPSYYKLHMSAESYDAQVRVRNTANLKLKQNIWNTLI
jgi:hypothetical protein